MSRICWVANLLSSHCLLSCLYSPSILLLPAWPSRLNVRRASFATCTMMLPWSWAKPVKLTAHRNPSMWVHRPTRSPRALACCPFDVARRSIVPMRLSLRSLVPANNPVSADKPITEAAHQISASKIVAPNPWASHPRPSFELFNTSNPPLSQCVIQAPTVFVDVQEKGIDDNPQAVSTDSVFCPMLGIEQEGFLSSGKTSRRRNRSGKFELRLARYPVPVTRQQRLSSVWRMYGLPVLQLTRAARLNCHWSLAKLPWGCAIAC